MNRIKHIVAILALASMVAFPVSAFAADATSNTTESLSVASTVSMTAPASATYTSSDFMGDSTPDFTTGVYDVTVIGSNNPSGVTVKATADPWVGPGGITAATTNRIAVIEDRAAGSGAVLTKSATLLPAGTFANSSTVVTFASSTGPLANRAIGVEFQVDGDAFSVGGEYTSAVHWTTSTNP